MNIALQDQKKFAARASWYYYKIGMTQGEIANRLGLTVKWEQMKFSGLIPSLKGQICDAIVQELFIKPKRVEVIDMIPFGYSAQSLVVNASNYDSISGPEDLSGLKVAVPNGTTIHNILKNLYKIIQIELYRTIFKRTAWTLFCQNIHQKF